MNIIKKLSQGLQKIQQTLSSSRQKFSENIFYQLSKNLFDVGLMDTPPKDLTHQAGSMYRNVIWGLAGIISVVSIPFYFLSFNALSFFKSIQPGLLSTLNNPFLWSGESEELKLPDNKREWLGFIIGLILGAPFGLVLGVLALILVRLPYQNIMSFAAVFSEAEDKRTAYEKFLGAPGLALGKVFEFTIDFFHSSSLRLMEISILFQDADEAEKELDTIQEKTVAKYLSFGIVYPFSLVIRGLIDLIFVGPFLGVLDGFSDKDRQWTALQKWTRGITYSVLYALAYLFDGILLKGFERAMLIINQSYQWIWEPENNDETPSLQTKALKLILSYPLGLALGVPGSVATVALFGSIHVAWGLIKGFLIGLIDGGFKVFEKQTSFFPVINSGIGKYSAYLTYVPSYLLSFTVLGSGIILYDNARAIWNGFLETIAYPAVTDVNSEKLDYSTEWSKKYTKHLGFAIGVALGLPYAVILAFGNFIKHSALSFYYGVIDGYHLASHSEDSTSDKRNEKAKNYGLLGYYLGRVIGDMYFILPKFFKEFTTLGYESALAQFCDKQFNSEKPADGLRTQLGYVIAYPLGFAVGAFVATSINSYESFTYLIKQSRRLAFYAYPENEALESAPGRYITGSLGYALGLIFAVPFFALSGLERIVRANFEMLNVSYTALEQLIVENKSDSYSAFDGFTIFDKIFALPGIALGHLSSFSVIMAQYSLQDFAQWFSWLSTLSIPEWVNVGYKKPNFMGIPGLIIGSTLGLASLAFITALRWSVYDPIQGLFKGMQAVFTEESDIQLYQLQYVFYPMGKFIAYQLQEGFYQMLKVIHLAVNDIFLEEIGHESNYKGSLGLIAGTAIGAGFGVLTYALRLMTYDLVLGATAGWNFAYTKFKKIKASDNLRSVGSLFWKEVFFGIGLVLMANYYGFLKLVPKGFNAVWNINWSFFEKEDPDISGWYFAAVFPTLMAGMILGAITAAALAVFNFAIRTIYESGRGFIHASSELKPDNEISGFFKLVYRFAYSVADYAIASVKVLWTLPHLDKEELPALPKMENTHLLGAFVGVTIALLPGILASFARVSYRVLTESIKTCQESFNKMASLEAYNIDDRTPIAQYGYGFLGLIPGAIAAIAVGALMGALVTCYAVLRAMTMTRDRFDGLDKNDEEVKKIKNLYASVDNWDRAIDVSVIQTFNQNTVLSGGKGANCFWSKAATLEATSSPSEEILDKIVQQKRAGSLSQDNVEALFKGKEELTTTKEAVVQYLFPTAS